jgi:hypothetical protein
MVDSGEKMAERMVGSQGNGYRGNGNRGNGNRGNRRWQLGRQWRSVGHKWAFREDSRPVLAWVMQVGSIAERSWVQTKQENRLTATLCPMTEHRVFPMILKEEAVRPGYHALLTNG